MDNTPGVLFERAMRFRLEGSEVGSCVERRRHARSLVPLVRMGFFDAKGRDFWSVWAGDPGESAFSGPSRMIEVGHDEGRNIGVGIGEMVVGAAGGV